MIAQQRSRTLLALVVALAVGLLMYGILFAQTWAFPAAMVVSIAVLLWKRLSEVENRE